VNNKKETQDLKFNDKRGKAKRRSVLTGT